MGLLDTPGQAYGVNIFQDVAGGARGDHLDDVLFRLGYRQRQDHPVGVLLFDRARSGDSPHFRHVEVHQDHIRLQPTRPLDRLPPGHRLAHYVDLREVAEHALHARPENGPIVGDQDADAALHSPRSVGPISVRTVPSSLWLTISRVPPINSARSRMPTNP